jgi:alpha-tubulin suppressor-like RCC1 family protein
MDTALAVDTTGQAWGWGLNSEGQLCTNGERNVPFQIPLRGMATPGVTALAGAGDHSIFVASINNTNTVVTCGANNHGDLGDGSKTPSPKGGVSTGLTVPSGATASVYASEANSGTLINGQYYSWGYNRKGNVGNGSKMDQLTPTLISLPRPVTSVGLGGSGAHNGQTLVLLSDGSVYGWGGDTYGQLGDGGSVNVRTPEPITTPAAFTMVRSGGQSSYGVDSAGNLWGWGDDSHNQMGTAPMIIVQGVLCVSSTSASEAVLLGSGTPSCAM